MTPTRDGSFRLFQLAGINVYLHWSWFIIVLLEIQWRAGYYSSALWNVAECLTLFGIVLAHEFGHSLACRQVGGKADQIVLWPLGGVAYVSPPQRPGATLWSIAAGPLVNVILFPILLALYYAGRGVGGDVRLFLGMILAINVMLLVFNLLPIYPLDGGQILRSLLWFVVGRARSLMVAAVIGFFGVAGLGLWAYLDRNWWVGILAVFIGMNCWRGFQYARALVKLDQAPRQAGFACPACRACPLAGEFWVCGNCQQPFDTFRSGAVCPHCGAQFPATRCVECGAEHPISEWARAS